MFLDRFGRRTGFGLIVLGICGIAAGVLTGIVLTQGLILGFETYLVYDYDSKFDDPKYEDCDTKDRIVYFYNLTNYVDVLNNNARPYYDEVGPYKFKEESCVFKEHADEHWRYYKQYWKPAVQTEGSTTDIIYNFNPAYSSINYQLHQQSGKENTERVLIQRMTGGFLQQVLSTLEGPNFTSVVTTKALPTVYLNIQSTAMNSMVTLVRLNAAYSVMWNVINSMANYYNSFTPERNFFNVAGPTYGVTTYYNTIGAGFPAYPYPNGTTWSDDAINKTLYLGATLVLPTSNVTIPSWRTANAAGMQSWLTWYQTASSNPTVKAAMISAYNYSASTSQLDLLANWLVNYMMTTVANSQLGGTSGVNSTAYQTFLGQWANCSALATGLDTNNDSVTPDGFELGTSFPIVNGSYPGATNVSYASAQSLWNTNSSTSIVTANGINAWFNAINTNNASLLYGLGAANGLSTTETNLLKDYLVEWQTTLVIPFLYQQLQITNLSDAAYIQWGSGTLLGQGVSVQSIQTSLPYPPEFAVYAYSVNSSIRFNLARSKFLLRDGHMPFFDGSTVDLFFNYFEEGDYSSIYNVWNLTQTEADVFAGYLKAFGTAFANWKMETDIFPNGGGIITFRTAMEWMYTAEDPLLLALGQDPYVGLQYNGSHASNYSEANAQEDYKEAIYRGGTRDDLKKFLEVKEYEGLTTVNFWAEPVKVKGNDGGDFWVPASLKEDETILVWNDRIVRPIEFRKTGEMIVKDIKLWQYEPVEDFWLNEIDNPANAFYFQEQTGLLNITPTARSETFISRPGFYGADIARSQVDGVDDSKEEFHRWILGINREAGFLMYKEAFFQISAQMPNFTEFYNVSGRIIPYAWFDEHNEVSDSKANRFKSFVNGAKNGSIAAYVVGCTVGGLMVIFGGLILLRYRWRKIRMFEEQVKGMNLVELPEKWS